MPRIHAAVGTGAVLAGAGLLLAACGGPDADVIRQQGELRSRLEAQSAEVEGLRGRVKELEARSRALEEQVAAVGLPRTAAPAAPGAAPSAAAAGTPVDPGTEGGSAETPAADVAALLESEEGKEKLRAFLLAEETRKREADRKQRREQMETRIRDRVSGYLTEQLNLTQDQQARVTEIAVDTMDRVGEVWRSARDGGGGGQQPDFQAMRDRTEEIRREAMDQLSQALTVDQYNKLQELGPSMGLMPGGRGGFDGGPPGGGQDGGAGAPAGRAGRGGRGGGR